MSLARDCWTAGIGMELWVARFGFVAVFAGTFLEGEAVLLAAGVLAHSGRLSLPAVIAAAFLGSWSGHLAWFAAGRHRGRALLQNRPQMRRAFTHVEKLISRSGVLAIFVTQYLYGTRLAAAVAFGMSRMSFLQFALVQVINCLVWSLAVGMTGYWFGEAAWRVLGRATHYEKAALSVILVAAILIATMQHLRRRHASPDGHDAAEGEQSNDTKDVSSHGTPP